MSPENGEDPVAKAIATVESHVAMRQWQVTITSTGRPAMAILPADCTDGELAEFCGWLLSQVLGQYRAMAKKPTIIVAKNLPG